MVLEVSALLKHAGDVSSEQNIATVSTRPLGDKKHTAAVPAPAAVTPPKRRARVGYLIMTSGFEELTKTKRLLEVTLGLFLPLCSKLKYTREQ